MPHQDNDKSSVEFYEHRDRIASALAEYERWQWQMQSEWAVETVKHLATVNIAGIAGAAALLASNQIPPNLLRWALIAFTVGLLLALLDFWLNSNGYWTRAMGVRQKTQVVSSATTFPALSRAVANTEDAGKHWFDVAVRVGWLSAIGAIIGGLLLGAALFTK